MRGSATAHRQSHRPTPRQRQPDQSQISTFERTPPSASVGQPIQRPPAAQREDKGTHIARGRGNPSSEPSTGRLPPSTNPGSKRTHIPADSPPTTVKGCTTHFPESLPKGVCHNDTFALKIEGFSPSTVRPTRLSPSHFTQPHRPIKTNPNLPRPVKISSMPERANRIISGSG